jgi:hypothetical protein
VPQLLEEEGFTHGIEIGVQRGLFAEAILTTWTRCTRYYLVDAWKQQENYFEGGNVADNVQDGLYKETQTRLQRWAEKTTLLRMFSSEAALKIPDDDVDFIYVDARHDYCGVKEDLELYWPKLKQGGIMAGHDYMTAEDVAVYMPEEDWGICADGSRNNGSVKAAVNQFAASRHLQIVVTYREAYPTWMIRKPKSNQFHKFIRCLMALCKYPVTSLLHSGHTRSAEA